MSTITSFWAVIASSLVTLAIANLIKTLVPNVRLDFCLERPALGSGALFRPTAPGLLGGTVWLNHAPLFHTAIDCLLGHSRQQLLQLR